MIHVILRTRRGQVVVSVPRMITEQQQGLSVSAEPVQIRRIAQELGIHPATVRRWLHRQSRPRVDQALTVSEVLGIPLERLWPTRRRAVADEIERLLGAHNQALPIPAALVLPLHAPPEAEASDAAPPPQPRPLVDGVNWSYSRLSDFLRCPAYGGFRHGLLPTPPDQQPEAPSPAAMIGSIVHRYAEATALLRRAAAGDEEARLAALELPGAQGDTPPPSAMAVVTAEIAAATRELELDAAAGETSATPDEETGDSGPASLEQAIQALDRDTRRLITAYDAYVLPYLNAARAVEDRRETQIGDFLFTAVVDMVMPDSTIRDLKTTAKTPSQATADGSMQATIYWKSERDLAGGDASPTVVFDYLVRLKREIRYVPLETHRTMADVDRLAHVTHGIATLIDTHNLYPNPVGNGCQRCPYLNACLSTYGTFAHPSQSESESA